MNQIKKKKKKKKKNQSNRNYWNNFLNPLQNNKKKILRISFETKKELNQEKII